MPTYTYQCESCGHGFESVQRFSDDALTECPECGLPIRRVIQPVGVVFKGSGWYINDSRPKGSGDGSDRAAKASTSPAGSDKPDKSDTSDKPAKSDSPDKPAKTEKTPAKVAD